MTAPMTRPRALRSVRRAWVPITAWGLVTLVPFGVLLYFRVTRGLATGYYIPLLIAWQLAVIIPASVLLPLRLGRLQQRVRAAQGMLCPGCLYDLRDTPEPAVCPECGLDLREHPVPSSWERALNRGRPFDQP